MKLKKILASTLLVGFMLLDIVPAFAIENADKKQTTVKLTRKQKNKEDKTMVKKVNTEEFQNEAMKAPVAVVDFNATWCGPCRSFAPIFEDVAEERSGKIRFVKVNTEAEPELSARFRIRSIPTIMIFKNGEAIDMLNGAVPKAPFESWLNESL